MYEKIEQMVKEGRLSFRGNHKTNAKHWLEKSEKRFLEEVQGSLMLQKYTKQNGELPVLRRAYCFKCGEYLNYFLEGEELVPDHPNTCYNEEEMSVTIKVPTGQLMISDWYEEGKEVIGHLDDYDRDIQSRLGKVKRTMDYAKENIAHFYVGNSSPTVFQKDSGLLFGSMGYDGGSGARETGFVCTDLWWVTVCDYTVYEKIAIEKHGEEKGKQLAELAKENADVNIQVEPGTYKLTYYIQPSDVDVLYGKLEKEPEAFTQDLDEENS